MATRDFDWAGFRALAKRLDDLVGGQSEDEEFAEDLRRALTFVYTAGVTMPTAGEVYEDAGGDAFWNDTVQLDTTLVDPAENEAAVAALAERIATSVEAVQPEGDLDSEEFEDVAETAAARVLDVRNAIADGSSHFDAGRLDEAAWEWSFGFDEWGGHALAGLSALHDLLWGAR